MVTKGIIKSIDLLGNTCTVHIPFFETAGNDPIIETATVSNTPGSYNGYKVGDAVYVAFEDGNMSTPVVIGKLYLGTEKEKADPRGVSNVEESTAVKKATLPADSKLTAQIDSNVPNTTVPYSSLSSIANGLNTLNTNVGQMDRDYGNRFKQVISDIEGNKSTLEQTADRMVAKVSGSKYKKDENGNILYNENNEPIIDTEVAKEEFGWELQKNKWTITSTNTEVLVVNNAGLKVTGEIVAEKGHLGKFIIGEEHEHKNDDGSTNPDLIESGIYTENYIDCFKQTPGEGTQLDDETVTGKTGVYIGTDGIRLGDKFSVDPEGNMTAAALTLMGNDLEGKIGTLDTTTKNHLEKLDTAIEVKSTNYYSDTEPSSQYTIKKGDCWFDTSSNLEFVTQTMDPAVDANGKFSTKEQYIGYYINRGTGSNPQPELITKNNLNLVTPGASGHSAFKLEQNCLKQWDGSTWVDIGGELVANKLTANYINALNITTKSLEVLDADNTKILFKADGTSDNRTVKIGGFNVTPSGLYTTGYSSSFDMSPPWNDADTGKGVYLGSDGFKLGTNFSLTTSGDIALSSGRIADSNVNWDSYTTPTTTTVNCPQQWYPVVTSQIYPIFVNNTGTSPKYAAAEQVTIKNEFGFPTTYSRPGYQLAGIYISKYKVGSFAKKLDNSESARESVVIETENILSLDSPFGYVYSDGNTSTLKSTSSAYPKDKDYSPSYYYYFPTDGYENAYTVDDNNALPPSAGFQSNTLVIDSNKIFCDLIIYFHKDYWFYPAYDAKNYIGRPLPYWSSLNKYSLWTTTSVESKQFNTADAFGAYMLGSYICTAQYLKRTGGLELIFSDTDSSISGQGLYIDSAGSISVEELWLQDRNLSQRLQDLEDRINKLENK